jgi:hypothetical protein
MQSFRALLQAVRQKEPHRTMGEKRVLILPPAAVLRRC